MKIGIGVSAGTDVVCAVLLVECVDGTHSVEYRTISADGDVNSDIGELVASAIELMASLAPSDPTSPEATGRRAPNAIAVSYRTTEQASSIRSALAHSDRSVLLVPEAAAAHAYLENSGLVARYDSVAVVDIGASGTTVSIIDPHTGTVHAADRTDRFGGTVADRILRDLVHGHNTIAEPSLRIDRGVKRGERSRISARYRAAKEHLSTADSAAVSGIEGASVDRASFADALRPRVDGVAEFTRETAASVDAAIEAVVLIGGGASIPLVRSTFESALKVPTLVPDEADTVLAKGAARLALDSSAGMHAAGTHYASTYDTVGGATNTSSRSVGKYSGAVLAALVAGVIVLAKYSGAVLAALVAGVIVLAYGVQALALRGEADVTPAGSAVESANNETRPELPEDEAPSVPTSTGTDSTVSVPSMPRGGPATTRATPTPTLTPAPDLPIIEWPARSTTRQLAPDPTPARSAPTSTEPESPPSTAVPSPTDSTEPDATPAPEETTAVPPSENPTESDTPVEPTPDSTTEPPTLPQGRRPLWSRPPRTPRPSRHRPPWLPRRRYGLRRRAAELPSPTRRNRSVDPLAAFCDETGRNRETRIGRHRQIGRLGSPGDEVRTQCSDHDAVVRAQSWLRNSERQTRCAAACLDHRSDSGIGRGTAAQDNRIHSDVLGRTHRLHRQHVRNRFLERRRDVRDRNAVPGTTARLDEARDRGLHTREREVVARILWAGHSSRKRNRSGITLARSVIESRTTGIAQSEESGDLVEGLTRRVIHRGPQLHDRRTEVVDVQEVSVSTGNQQGHARGHRTVFERVDGNVTTEVIDRVEGHTPRSRIRFGSSDADQQAPARPGPIVTATASGRSISAVASARRIVGTIASRCAREATSGTTPPYRACSSTLDATSSASSSQVPDSCQRTIPTPVSSQELSMPMTFRPSTFTLDSPPPRPGAAS
ncbi:hypothetical protein BJF84_16435 [Rhodococcus sp. CUA-806]|nr:hypothetical protein BJF84_16435 [Rhodococcus sp. CUA-806]